MKFKKTLFAGIISLAITVGLVSSSFAQVGEPAGLANFLSEISRLLAQIKTSLSTQPAAPPASLPPTTLSPQSPAQPRSSFTSTLASPTITTSSVGLTSPITGTGTPDRIPKFLQPTVIGDSLISESPTGNIGIGLARPSDASSTLHVADVKSDLFSIVNVNANVFGWGLRHYRGNSSSSVAFAIVDNSTNQDRFSINNNGNVGIGGNVAIGTASQSARLTVRTDSSQQPAISVLSPNQSTSTLIFVNGNGAVGFGTANPLAHLHVAGPGPFGSSIRIANTTLNQDGWSLRHLSPNVFTITDNMSRKDRIFIDNFGNVGIGALATSSPNVRLKIDGGHVAITKQGTGLILRATDGPNCFILTVDNGGALHTTATSTCP